MRRGVVDEVVALGRRRVEGHDVLEVQLVPCACASDPHAGCIVLEDIAVIGMGHVSAIPLHANGPILDLVPGELVPVGRLAAADVADAGACNCSPRARQGVVLDDDPVGIPVILIPVLPASPLIVFFSIVLLSSKSPATTMPSLAAVIVFSLIMFLVTIATSCSEQNLIEDVAGDGVALDQVLVAAIDLDARFAVAGDGVGLCRRRIGAANAHDVVVGIIAVQLNAITSVSGDRVPLDEVVGRRDVDTIAQVVADRAVEHEVVTR
jgi:hypothetical protein